jgi:16S rRNA (cytidine1402-2'-O)-methyltransferase
MNSPHTLIFYESPYRLIPFLEDALEVFGDRQSAVANDLTKLFEQLDRGTISELIANFKAKAPRGEYTVVINGLNTKNSPDADNNAEEEDID